MYSCPSNLTRVEYVSTNTFHQEFHNAKMTTPRVKSTYYIQPKNYFHISHAEKWLIQAKLIPMITNLNHIIEWGSASTN